jgi:hypothetical protein
MRRAEGNADGRRPRAGWRRAGGGGIAPAIDGRRRVDRAATTGGGGGKFRRGPFGMSELEGTVRLFQ